MPARKLIAIAVALVAGFPPPSLAASFNLKPGVWRMMVTTLTVGNPLPPDVLAGMPPAKRARVEAAMKERATKPIAHEYKTCVTQKELDQDRIVKSGEDDSKCTRKVVSKSTTKIVMEQTCPAPHASTSQMTMEAKTPENLSATIARVRGDGNGKVDVDIKGFWLGASCAGIKGDD